MKGSPSHGPREAALMLHALPAVDRAWVVARLEPSERQCLQPLLDELEALGIPRDRDLVAQALATQPFAPVPAPTGRRVLEAAAPTALAELLKGEPPGLVARLLAAYPGPWSQAVLQALDTSVRQRVNEALRTLPPAGPECRLQDWLVEALSRKLHEAHGHEPARPGHEPRGN